MRTLHEVSVALKRHHNTSPEYTEHGALHFTLYNREFYVAPGGVHVDGEYETYETFLKRITFSRPYQALPGRKTGNKGHVTKKPSHEVTGKKKEKTNKKGGKKKVKHY
jgi:hypothetical protein